MVEERKLVNLLLEETKLVHQELENKFNKDLITNFHQNHTDIKNDIISQNLALKITLSDRRKKKWLKCKIKNCVMRTLCRSTRVFDFVEVTLARSKYVNVTSNRKHRKRISKDSRQKLKNDKLENFSGNKEAVVDEQYSTDVAVVN